MVPSNILTALGIAIGSGLLLGAMLSLADRLMEYPPGVSSDRREFVRTVITVIFGVVTGGIVTTLVWAWVCK
jgi:hypothetical protein